MNIVSSQLLNSSIDPSRHMILSALKKEDSFLCTAMKGEAYHGADAQPWTARLYYPRKGLRNIVKEMSWRMEAWKARRRTAKNHLLSKTKSLKSQSQSRCGFLQRICERMALSTARQHRWRRSAGLDPLWLAFVTDKFRESEGHCLQLSTHWGSHQAPTNSSNSMVIQMALIELNVTKPT